MNYTEIKLGELLSSDNQAIKRNATGILRILQKNQYYKDIDIQTGNIKYYPKNTA